MRIRPHTIGMTYDMDFRWFANFDRPQDLWQRFLGYIRKFGFIAFKPEGERQKTGGQIWLRRKGVPEDAGNPSFIQGPGRNRRSIEIFNPSRVSGFVKDLIASRVCDADGPGFAIRFGQEDEQVPLGALCFTLGLFNFSIWGRW